MGGLQTASKSKKQMNYICIIALQQLLLLSQVIC
jgi:hypothetical protein